MNEVARRVRPSRPDRARHRPPPGRGGRRSATFRATGPRRQASARGETRRSPTGTRRRAPYRVRQAARDGHRHDVDEEVAVDDRRRLARPLVHVARSVTMAGRATAVIISSRPARKTPVPRTTSSTRASRPREPVRPPSVGVGRVRAAAPTPARWADPAVPAARAPSSSSADEFGSSPLKFGRAAAEPSRDDNSERRPAPGCRRRRREGARDTGRRRSRRPRPARAGVGPDRHDNRSPRFSTRRSLVGHRRRVHMASRAASTLWAADHAAMIGLDWGSPQVVHAAPTADAPAVDKPVQATLAEPRRGRAWTAGSASDRRVPCRPRADRRPAVRRRTAGRGPGYRDVTS